MSSGGLSDVLRQMAEGEAPGGKPTPAASPQRATAPPPPPPPAEARAVEPAIDEEDEEVVAAELDEPVAPAPAQRTRRAAPPPPAPARAVAPPRRTPAPAARAARASSARAIVNQNAGSLKETGACVFTTVGVLMLVVAIWGTLVLSGMKIYRYDQPNAQMMAKVAHVFYPIGLIGVGYAVFLFKSAAADKRRAAEPRRVTRR